MPKTITYIISRLEDSHEMRAVAQQLQEGEDSIQFLLLQDKETPFEQYLHQQSIPVQRIHYSGKRDIPKALWTLYRWLRSQQPEIVHTHLFEGSLLGLFAAWAAGIAKRVHTRHHSTFHHDYHPAAVKYDRVVNKLSTQIIAISENVKNVLLRQENVSPSKVTIIYHGVDLKKFRSVPEEEVEHLRQKYQVPQHGPVIGMIAKYVRLKGHQYAIEALRHFLQEAPETHLVIANAQGPDNPHIRQQLQQLPGTHYTEIPYEPNIFALYQLFDIFIHVPVNRDIEAFGQVYLEALAAGVPSVFTKSGIAPELIKHRENAYVADFRSAQSILQGLQALYEEKELRQQLIQQGRQDVRSFDIDHMITDLQKFYDHL